jgi:ligand-binding sensor domain-containing protein
MPRLNAEPSGRVALSFRRSCRRHGLIRYQDGDFRIFSPKDGFTSSFVRAVYEVSAANIRVGTDSGLFRFSGERLNRIDSSGTIPTLSVHAITGDNRGGIWVWGTALVRLDQQGVQNLGPITVP